MLHSFPKVLVKIKVGGRGERERERWWGGKRERKIAHKYVKINTPTRTVHINIFLFTA